MNSRKRRFCLKMVFDVYLVVDGPFLKNLINMASRSHLCIQNITLGYGGKSIKFGRNQKKYKKK